MNKTPFFLSSSEWHSQTVCEVKVEKEANGLMHFPLMENWTQCPKSFIHSQPLIANKMSKVAKMQTLT